MTAAKTSKSLSTDRLLAFLKENTQDYLSGEEIAQKVGVSRTAVWNHIQALREMGYELEAVPHRGYRLVGRPERLLPDEITEGLATRRFGKKISVYEQVDSTNDTAMTLAQNGAVEGTAVFAESQKKGRGRLGRPWHSPRGKGLWFSIVLRPSMPLASSPRITLAAAVGVAKALREETGLPIQIKWPNDLYLEGKKLGGILTELDTDLETIRYAILGIGINVNSDAGDFPRELRPTAISLKMALGKKVDRNKLARALLEHLEAVYDRLGRGEFQDIRQEWSSFSLSSGRWVQVITQKRSLEGIAEGVDTDGCLIIRKENGLQEHVLSGDVVLRD